MAKLVVLRGLPGSGKTTWAREWVAAEPNRARVNRDDLRMQLHNGAFVKGVTEPHILIARDALVAGLLAEGISVVSDDTNLPNFHVRSLERIASRAKAEFEIVDLTNVPLDVCIDRDSHREGRSRVGRAVIEDFYYRHISGRAHPLPYSNVKWVPHGNSEPVTGQRYVPAEGKPRAIIVDIDGTVALKGDRSPFDESRVLEDKPNVPVLEAVYCMEQDGYQILWCSGRTDGCREDTATWLAEHFGYDESPLFLFMRKSGDTRKDAIVKLEIFDEHIRNNYYVVGVFDDRQQVVDMWRSIGLTVFQVAPGDF